jgi:hypothetical protein
LDSFFLTSFFHILNFLGLLHRYPKRFFTAYLMIVFEFNLNYCQLCFLICCLFKINKIC